ncbi:hypothetical protein FACS1894191_8760 [Clostridia bacterium]|nr:hypothetical protein FACS1894191_8760 [Clostridia bacterium]
MFGISSNETLPPFSIFRKYSLSLPLNHTRPQWRVKVRPSDTKKEYPVDIAVFNSAEHIDDSISIIVECKKKNPKITALTAS